MVTRLIQMVSNHHFLQIGNGENYVHLTYIDDLISGLRLAMSHPKAAGETFIFAGPSPVQIKVLLKIIEDLTQISLPKWYIPTDFAHTCGGVCETIFRMLPPSWEPPITREKVDNLCANRGFSWEKAAQKLGYRPHWGCEQGIKATLAWLGQKE
jgi:nucleoside-diphosphate-sugar epimerase